MKKTASKFSLLMSGILLSGSLFLTTPVMAETKYISDVVYVPLRAGPSNQFKILHRGLKTGVRMTVLEADAGNGYSKIRTSGGLEGFIQKHYLVSEEPARTRLPKELEKMAQLEQSIQPLKETLQETNSALQDSESSLDAATRALDEKTSEFIALREATADPQALDLRNKELMEENLQLKNRVEVVAAENSQLVNNTSLRWYLYGGGTVLLGILLGLFLPRLRIQRKTSSDWV
ncbi:TIGR04211 family SH3 domain-containing protein [Endozoicomonas sp. OPT23]|uniref:TIGR04211 family SH3 domain-containing protein n=1 Tax=Endozoicomonas sp. OPT23 TaxID=2072845 RepID=UPI00189195F9